MTIYILISKCNYIITRKISKKIDKNGGQVKHQESKLKNEKKGQLHPK